MSISYNDRPDPWLLTPGPLTTSASVKQAMLRDWGSRDEEFIAMNHGVCERLLALAGARGSHVCVPLQGSGTFAVEATVGTLVPPDGKLLVLVNGAYGRRIVTIARYLGRACTTLETREDVPNDPQALDQKLTADQDITHVFAVHCETTSGILNPLAEIADATARHGRRLLVDAMSAFGAISLDLREMSVDAVAASANKCLEGVPGMGFVIVRKALLEQCKAHSHSLALDLYEQWVSMQGNGQWRFTPPTHVIAALSQALDEHQQEGGVPGRGARYRRNCEVLVQGMRDMGFETLLADELQAPIIVTFHMPADPNFVFDRFYDLLSQSGYVIYPGKLTTAETFRIGCIGRLGESEMQGALAAVRQALEALEVRSGSPRIASRAQKLSLYHRQRLEYVR